MSGPLALVYPVLAQVLLTFVAASCWSGGSLSGRAQRQVRVARHRAVRRRLAGRREEGREQLRNQFETPVLFYVLCGVATYIGATGVRDDAARLGLCRGARRAHSHPRDDEPCLQRFAVFAIGLRCWS